MRKMVVSSLLFLMTLTITEVNANVFYGEYRKEIKAMTTDGHKPMTSYRRAKRQIMQNVDLERDSGGFYIKDVYCRMVYRRQVGPNSIPSANKVNIEHTWPRSRMAKKGTKAFKMQEADLFNLYPTNSQSNSTRSSHYFADVPGGKNAAKKCSASKIGKNKHTGRTGFEPPKEHKGNVARTIFYMAVRYDFKIRSSEERYLRQWHLLDPVDADERKRNSEIEQIQGNRNPFIDEPELVELIQDF